MKNNERLHKQDNYDEKQQVTVEINGMIDRKDSFDINKSQFGNFVMELRKLKGMTQKELAEKLFVSDKAVSKWETGLSLPDIVLLKPLADVLDVTVAELLEGRRIENTEHMNTEKVDAIIHKALYFTEEELTEQRRNRKKNGRAFVVCTIVGCVEILFLPVLDITWEQIALQNILLMMIMGFVFGIWFCFFAKEKLPAYYDENRITSYSDGFFRMNLVNTGFNNRNWKHILRVGRIWSMATMVGAPLLCLVLNLLFDDMNAMMISYVLTMILILGGLFIPMCVVAKKYEKNERA